MDMSPAGSVRKSAPIVGRVAGVIGDHLAYVDIGDVDLLSLRSRSHFRSPLSEGMLVAVINCDRTVPELPWVSVGCGDTRGIATANALGFDHERADDVYELAPWHRVGQPVARSQSNELDSTHVNAAVRSMLVISSVPA